MVCSAMEFHHLPMEGGLFDQHPGFLDAVIYIMREKSEYDRQEEAKKTANKGGPSLARRAKGKRAR